MKDREKLTQWFEKEKQKGLTKLSFFVVSGSTVDEVVKEAVAMQEAIDEKRHTPLLDI